MPLEEYLTEEDIKSYIPELSRFLWSEETDYTNQKTQAVNEVKLELASRGFNPALINPRLVIRYAGISEESDHTTSPTSEDTAARLRYVLIVKEFTPEGQKTLNLEGSNDKTNWNIIDSRKAEVIGTITFMLNSSYLYYRLRVIITGGAIDYDAYLCDTGIEKLIAYKWLELILLDRITQDSDQYHLKMKYFKGEYEKLLGRIKIWEDNNSDGVIDSNEFNRTSSIRMLK